MKKIFSLGLIGLGLIVSTAVTLKAATELARINTRVITLEEFNKKYQENLKFFPASAPSKRAVLDDLIKRELGIQEAKKLGLDKDPEVIDRMNTVLYHALIDKKLNKEFESIHIDDVEAKNYYSKNPEIRSSHIFIAVPPGAKPEEEQAALKRIKQAQQEVRAGKSSFAEIAQRLSEGPAAPMGGDIDYQTKDKLPTAYYEAARKLRVGQVSDIVRSQFGYHLIKVTAVRPWEETDRPLVKRQLAEEKRNEIYSRFMDRLRTQYKVSVNHELLKE